MLEKLQGFRVDIIALSIIAISALREAYAALTAVDVADICIDDIGYLRITTTNPEYSPVYILWLDVLEKSVGTINALFVRSYGYCLHCSAGYDGANLHSRVNAHP